MNRHRIDGCIVCKKSVRKSRTSGSLPGYIFFNTTAFGETWALSLVCVHGVTGVSYFHSPEDLSARCPRLEVLTHLITITIHVTAVAQCQRVTAERAWVK